jgi:hypothetical protein
MSSEFSLKLHQSDVVERVVRTCRDQFGILLFHRMGSGKTISGLTILKNFPQNLKRVIIVPNSNASLYSTTSEDVVRLYGNNAELVKKWKIVTYDRTLNGQPSVHELTSGSSSLPFEELLKDAVVLVDEAHNLLPMLKSQCNRLQPDNVLRGFANAARVILMTGTPIISDVSDLTNLLSVLAPRLNLPRNLPVFESIFYHRTKEDKARMRGDMVSTGLLTVGQQYGVPFVTGDSIQRLVKLGLDSVGLASLSTLMGLGGLQTMAVSILLSKVATGAAATMLLTQFMTTIKTRVLTEKYLTLNNDRLLKVVSPFISFYDYSNALEEKGKVPRYDYPITMPMPSIHQVVYTWYQLQLLVRMTAKDVFFTQRDQIALGMALYENIHDRMTYERYVCRLGCVSPDAVNYDGVLQKQTQMRYENGEGLLDVLLQETYTVQPRYPDDTNRPQYKETYPFACPKFRLAVGLLLRYATQERPHCMTYSALVRWNQPESVYNERQVAAPQCFAVNEKRQLVSDYDQDTKRYRLKETPKERYLPVVYAAFEDTFRQFSAYLTARGLPHLVVQGDDTPERRAVLQNVGYFGRFSILPPVQNDDDFINVEEPVCILLHPTVIEGESFVLNPCLIALEQIEGYGVQEQVYGRVLRQLKFAEANTVQNDNERPLKMIYQLRSGHFGVSSASDAEQEKLWYSKQTPLLFSFPFQLGTENLVKIQGSMAVSFLATLFRVTKATSTVISLPITEALKLQGLYMQQEFKRHTDYTGSLFSRFRSINPVRWTDSLFMLFAAGFQSWRFRDMDPTPERFTAVRNDAQARVVYSIGEAFEIEEGGKRLLTDTTISKTYCSPPSSSCLVCLGTKTNTDECCDHVKITKGHLPNIPLTIRGDYDETARRQDPYNKNKEDSVYIQGAEDVEDDEFQDALDYFHDMPNTENGDEPSQRALIDSIAQDRFRDALGTFGMIQFPIRSSSRTSSDSGVSIGSVSPHHDDDPYKIAAELLTTALPDDDMDHDLDDDFITNVRNTPARPTNSRRRASARRMSVPFFSH